MTILIKKDPSKGSQVSNYHLIVSLPIIWKLLTGIMREKLYIHLERMDCWVTDKKNVQNDLEGQKNPINCRQDNVIKLLKKTD